ncbi:transcriptional regulator [Psychrobacter sp. PAMC 21119]|uniref:transcriptional regulator n=1 Tax=Psychrobacter sp. PAMC 21119 TaxID=1112209 RepID=UPI00055DB76E|nr:transcriptional regulator [Psychrobacter sp. PAMC 21119]
MTDIRIDCLLGHEIRMMRMATDGTLLTMSDALGWQVSKLSRYECRIGALTNDSDAKAIEDYCIGKGYTVTDCPKALSGQEKLVDLKQMKATVAKWRENVEVSK